MSPIATFAGPIDKTTFTITSSSHWPIGQKDALCFIRLSTYIACSDGPFQGRSYYMYHVLLLFPLSQNPWKTRCQGWATRNPLQDRNWIFGVGHVVGVLNPDLLSPKPANYEGMPILIIIPYEFQIVGKDQLDGGPPPPYVDQQQSAQPSTPSQKGKPKSRRHNTSASPEQARQTGMTYLF